MTTPNRSRPESAFIRGNIWIDVPVPVRDVMTVKGYEWKSTDIVKLLNTIPTYSPFIEAEGYYFDVEHFQAFISFVLHECIYPEGVNAGDPFVPELWQWSIYANMFFWKSDKTNLRRFREVFIYVPRKNGKLLNVATLIPTVNGMVQLQDLKINDTVFDKDGKQCHVVWKSNVQVPEKAYTITFANGTKIDACSEHQWHVFSKKQHPKYKNKTKSANRRAGEKTVTNQVDRCTYEDVWTTQELVDTGVDCSYGKTFFIKMHDGIECEKKELPIDPYILGSWLGDGTAVSKHITVGSQDIHAWEGRRRTETRPGVFKVWIDELGGSVLRVNNLRNNKHIPESYFTASREQRLSLLQGLMDTDGTISKRGTDLSIVQKSKVLADDIVRLLYSLGLKATIKQVTEKSQNNTEGVYYHIQFAAGRDTHPVFRLQRKLDRMRPTAARSRNNHIISIEPCEPSEMMCIQVDSASGTYLFGEQYLTTHNTSGFGMIPTLWEFFCGTEKRAQLFCCAADTEQASVNFRHSIYSIESNNRLLSRLREGKVNRSTRSFEHTDGTTFKVLSSIAETKHGLSPSFVYCDEVHAHKDSELIDVMITGMAARAQPLLIYTTTADYDRPSVCNSLYDRAKSIASGAQSDPTFLPVIYEAQVDDDFRQEKVWEKANPNYGKSIYAEHFERMIRTAENNPAELNRFLRLHLNVRTKTETAWIPPHVWAHGNAQQNSLLSINEIKAWLYDHSLWHNIASSDKWGRHATIDLYIDQYRNYYSWYINKVEELRDEECYGGYDNAAVKDIAAFTLWFPNQRTLLFWGWCPAESIYRRSVEQNVPYGRWYEAGLINNTPQANISESDIGRALIGTDSQPGIGTWFNRLMSVSFDRWGSNYLHEVFSSYGINARAYPQTFAGMNQPCRQMETMLANHEFWHGDNPVLAWMIGNTMVETNRDEQIRPSRKNSSDKIDGIVSGLMAIGGWLYPDVETIHDIRGLRD